MASSAQGNATVRNWHVNGEQVGTWASARGLHWAKIANASHMVPIEAPEAAHDLFLRFANVSTLDAAGKASRLASTLGGAAAVVIGHIAPDGDTLAISDDTMSNSTLLGAGGSDAKDEAQLREEYYGPRRSIVLVLLLIGLLVAIAFLVRLHQTKRRRAGRTRPNSLDRGRAADEEEDLEPLYVAPKDESTK